MARPRRIPLRQPDRAAPRAPTLLDLAAVHAPPTTTTASTALSPAAERLLESALWTASLAALHLTFDVLAQHQYAVRLAWPSLCARTARAWLLFLPLFYVLHPHAAERPVLVPALPMRAQRPLRQAVFFVAGVAAGCRLVYVSNAAPYLATMKQAPPLGCLWLWAVVELHLPAALSSLALVALFVWHGGYAIR